MGAFATAGKIALRGGKFLGKGNIATALATIAISELISRVLEDAAGDPEAAVNAIIAAGQQKATTEAMLAQTQPLEVQEAKAEAFRYVRPEKNLTELALQRRGAMAITPDDTPVLSYLTQKLGVPPDRLMNASNPARMGDFSELQGVLPPNLRSK